MKHLKLYLFYALAVVVFLIVAFFWVISILFTIAKIMAIVGVVCLSVEFFVYKMKKVGK